MNNGQECVDINNFPMGWPNRSGSLVIENGQKLAMKYWTIELSFTVPNPLPSTITVPLNNAVQGFLLNAFYWSIEAYSAATIGKTPSGATPIPQANFNSSYITLYDNKSFVFWNSKPLRDLQTINDTDNKTGKQYVDSLAGQVINWQNSQIVIADTTSLTPGNTYVILLGLAYTLYANYQIDGVGTSDPNKVNNNNYAGA